MKMKKAFMIAALALGCSGADESFTCEPGDRSGTYVIHYSERPNGTCGEPPDEVTRLDGGPDPSCTLDAPDMVSADQCRLDRSITCCGEGGICSHIVGYTEQQDESGARITGTITVRIDEANPFGGRDPVCVSTFDIVATRM
jgi:hypothetical protein